MAGLELGPANQATPIFSSTKHPEPGSKPTTTITTSTLLYSIKDQTRPDQTRRDHSVVPPYPQPVPRTRGFVLGRITRRAGQCIRLSSHGKALADLLWHQAMRLTTDPDTDLWYESRIEP